MQTKKVLLILVLCFLLVSPAFAIELGDLTENQSVHGFKTISLYENASGNPMGARFISERFGFLIDYLQIESVPQAFYWVKSVPSSSKGEPHSCEHLLLGKGNRGRYVAALEDMALSSSTAYTSQLRTCYHFNTIAGDDTFYEIFEAKMQAMLHPDFTDEEIRREVCFVGVNVDQETGELSLDEKGTCYTEMVSSFEKPWYYSYGTMDKVRYGEEHPLVYNSGGAPDVMRTMVPDDMWSFHKETHHLSNMGAVVSMPTSVSLEEFLTAMNKMLENCQSYNDTNPTPTIRVQNLQPANSAPAGTIKMAYYPSANESDPGYMMYAWPPMLKLDATEEMMFSLFLETFSSGQTSNLYNMFINSGTKKIDIGGNYIYGSYDNELDLSPYIVFSGVNKDAITEENMQTIKEMIAAELKRIQDFKAGSEELKEFNSRLKSSLVSNKKQIENYLNSPPMFGFRSGPAGGWISLLIDVEQQPNFRKSLVFKDTYEAVEKMLMSDENLWADRINDWKLLAVDPYAIGTIPSKSILDKNAADKAERIANYIAGFKEKYGTDDTQEAIAMYKNDFDAKTAELEALNSNDKLPGFISNPPLTLDDQLNYQDVPLVNNINMVASTFDNMTASTVGLSMGLNVIPESLLVYAPLLPDMLTSIGVVKDGEVVTYDKMNERLQNEVLGFYAGIDVNGETDRIELTLTGRGSNLDELKNAISWMDASLFSSYLSVDNLDRIADVIDQSLISYRNRMKSSEENWVNDPTNAYRFQKNPLYMSTNSFLTETHHLNRLKWMFTNPGNESEQQSLQSEIDLLAQNGNGKNREELMEYLDNYEIIKSDKLPENGVKIVKDIVNNLKTTLADIPDENLVADWDYLCSSIKNDLMVKPEKALAQMKHVISLVTKSDNARMYMVSNSADREKSLENINGLLSKLDTEPSERQTYSSIDNVVERLKSRANIDKKPTYAGLVFDGTRNGVLLFSAKANDKFDSSEEAMLKTLSGKLYGGGGPHGLFMKTWAAGLAYSNGFGLNQRTGRASYYAERCPDVAETMRFVVNQLKNAEENPDLADYTIAQVFGFSRAPNRYEQRGKAIADDLADGMVPDQVAAYRQHILDIRKNKENFYTEIKNRMEDAYGSVLIGYGKPLSESQDGNFFLIGPEPQFESLEKYIKQTEGEQPVYRLYPRDFWLTN